MLEATKSPESRTDADAPVNPALAAEAKIARIAVTVFPLLVVAAGVAGFLLPGAFKPLAPGVPYLLGIIMFSMGRGAGHRGALRHHAGRRVADRPGAAA